MLGDKNPAADRMVIVVKGKAPMKLPAPAPGFDLRAERPEELIVLLGQQTRRIGDCNEVGARLQGELETFFARPLFNILRMFIIMSIV